MKIPYIDKNFRESSLQIIAQADDICEEYAGQGFDLTLRQLYYQFVARDLLDNTQRNYKKLGKIISDARLAGMLDWDHLVDRTRSLRGINDSISPAAALRRLRHGYHLERWDNQDTRLEVWVEKEALIGVFARICNRYNVDFFACKGYVSQSEMWRAAQRHIGYETDGQEVVVVHFGDHDPSGVDMTRDIQDRLYTFGAGTTVDRVALTMEQVNEHQPPPNPTKFTDSRASDYIAQYGYESWELDALNPDTLSELVEDEVNEYRDMDKWAEVDEQERNDKKVFAWLSDKSSLQLHEMRINDAS